MKTKTSISIEWENKLYADSNKINVSSLVNNALDIMRNSNDTNQDIVKLEDEVKQLEKQIQQATQKKLDFIMQISTLKAEKEKEIKKEWENAEQFNETMRNNQVLENALDKMGL